MNQYNGNSKESNASSTGKVCPTRSVEFGQPKKKAPPTAKSMSEQIKLRVGFDLTIWVQLIPSLWPICVWTNLTFRKLGLDIGQLGLVVHLVLNLLYYQSKFQTIGFGNQKFRFRFGHVCDFGQTTGRPNQNPDIWTIGLHVRRLGSGLVGHPNPQSGQGPCMTFLSKAKFSPMLDTCQYRQLEGKTTLYCIVHSTNIP